jgi:hypothetical protein
MHWSVFFQTKKLSFFLGIAFIFFTLSTSGCKKKDITYEIQGTIADASFQNNLAGAEVALIVYPNGSTVGSVHSTVITGSDGAYSFSLKREKYAKIEISVTKPNYFSKSTTRLLDDLSLDEANTIGFALYARSWVRIHITGNGSKTVKYIRQEGISGCSECCPEGERFFYNVTDTSIYCINNGNTLYQVYYNVLTTSQQGALNVTSVPFDTTELLIAY